MMVATPERADLQPQVEVRCAVCGGDGRERVCSAAEVRAQLEYLQAFHRRRLKAAARRGDDRLADRAEFTQQYATDIVACGACGLVFREPRPRAAAVVAAYARDEYGRARLDALFESQVELFRAKVRGLQRLLTSRVPPSVVEIGSFVGGFLAAAWEQGWSALGVDPGEEVVEFCRDKGLRVERATAPEASIAGASIDCVAIWNTFDQLPDPRPTLTALRRWLRPGGVLAIRVPNGIAFCRAMGALRALPSAMRGPLLSAMAWNNLLAFPYLHGYSTAPLDRLLRELDFTPIAVQPDTLARLADADTKPWARWEERLLKLAWGSAGAVYPRIAPWFDAYYRRSPPR